MLFNANSATLKSLLSIAINKINDHFLKMNGFLAKNTIKLNRYHKYKPDNCGTNRIAYFLIYYMNVFL